MARAAIVLLAAPLLACGGASEPEEPPGRSRVLALALEGTGLPAPDPQRLLHYQIFAERPDWALMAGQVQVGRIDGAEGQAGVLWLSGPVGEQRWLELRIRGAFDPREIDRLELGLVFEGELGVLATLQRGSAIVASGQSRGRGSGGLQPIEVLFEPATDHQPCDQLAVRFEGLERVGVVALEAFHDPPGANLPEIGAPALVDIDGELRRAAGLASGRVAQARFTVEPGHALSVGYGLPFLCRGPLPPIEVELQLFGSQGLTQTYGLPFEHDVVVVYSEYPPEYLKKRAIISKLMRVHPNERATLKKQLEDTARKQQDPRAAFGESPKQKQEQQQEKIDPASLPQGLIEGWIERTIDLEPFVGQEVVARFELIAATGESAACALANPALVATEGQAPCVLLITSDAHRADHLSAAGVHGAIETPWIDLWMRRGTLFTNAWSSSNAPLDALGALFSGRPAGAPELPGGQRLTQRFAAAGWTTAAVISSSYLAPDRGPPVLAGFERVTAPPGHELTAREAIDALLEELSSLEGQSTFAWLQLSDASAPYDPPAEFRRTHYSVEADSVDADPGAAETEDSRAIPAWAEGIDDVGYVEALYSGEVTWLDRRLRLLVEHKRLERATVAFAGTCGESLVTFDHARLSAETLRVPLFLTGPGLARRPVARAVPAHDLGRTLLERAGLEAGSFPGCSLLTRPPLPPGGEPQFARSPGEAVVARGEYLLRLALAADGSPEGPARLHDIAIDESCTVDIAEAHPGIALELEGLLRAWLAPAPPGPAPAEPTDPR
jgi:arylsulfatase